MRTGFLLTVVLLLMAVVAQAADVFIYNYDFDDMIWDPVLGDSVDCGHWIEQTLLAIGDDVDSGTSMPTDLSQYDMVFVTMGFFRC